MSGHASIATGKIEDAEGTRREATRISKMLTYKRLDPRRRSRSAYKIFAYRSVPLASKLWMLQQEAKNVIVCVKGRADAKFRPNRSCGDLDVSINRVHSCTLSRPNDVTTIRGTAT